MNFFSFFIRGKGKINTSSLMRYLFLIFFMAGGAGFIATWFIFPHLRATGTLFEYIVYIILFLIILTGISLFPNRFKNGYLLLIIIFLVSSGLIDAKLTFYALRNLYDKFYSLYYRILFPGIIFSICLAFRLAGGTPGQTLKIGISGIIILFSGYIDVMWFIVNGVKFDPSKVIIPHISEILGYTPSFTGVLLFMSVHFIFLILLILLPIDRWLHFLLTTSPEKLEYLQKKETEPVFHEKN